MSSYTGRVSPGGVPAVHELARLVVTKAAVGPLASNVYVLRDRFAGDELLIDAAASPARVLELCGDGPLRYVVTTHRHPDHWGALAEVAAAVPGAVTVAHAADAPAIPVPTALVAADGDVLRFGDVAVELIHLAGHTPGGLAVLYDDPTGPPHIWTGDSLFPGGVGKTRSAADFTSLLDDVEAKLFDRLPDETWVYPGHGDDTTLGAERPHLAAWRARGW
ncbi:MBL fold metallo-hydrolase [Jiangella sp. DSM 45060]|uniref:MBL fold metallo-hydrolase n=1 Tax=Jiangella sp. DSM 45060 TaxID=1798224 RepID=UPI00087B2124|nr:MBL fold metallo-hydrolase [Jiangella sp. DSM 45060]SDS79138.1 Glyoxylase, beta-lactamase superfamily II [Jiangella sp. DSM 45060]